MRQPITLDYLIDGDVKEPFLFGVEFNFSFLGSGGDRFMETGIRKTPFDCKRDL